MKHWKLDKVIQNCEFLLFHVSAPHNSDENPVFQTHTLNGTSCPPPQFFFLPLYHLLLKAEKIIATTFFETTAFSGNNLGMETPDMSGRKPIWTNFVFLN